MRYDITLSLVVSMDVYDQAEAEKRAEEIASAIEREAAWEADDTHPAPLAVVEEITAVV